MTLLIRLDPSRYPYSLAQLRLDEPQLSLSADPHDGELAALAELGILVARVLPTPGPADTREQRAEESFPEQDGATWHQAWTVRDATEEEIAAWDIAHRPEPQWMAFGLAMATSTAIAALYAALPVPVANALSIGLSDAAKGDDRLFAGLWQQVAAGGAISAELLAEITAVATDCHLPQSFIDSLQFSNEV